jgi:hypothetical protein
MEEMQEQALSASVLGSMFKASTASWSARVLKKMKKPHTQLHQTPWRVNVALQFHRERLAPRNTPWHLLSKTTDAVCVRLAICREDMDPHETKCPPLASGSHLTNTMLSRSGFSTATILLLQHEEADIF